MQKLSESFGGLEWWWWGCGDLCMNPSGTSIIWVIPSSGLSLAEWTTVVEWSVAKRAFTLWRPLAPIKSPWSPVTQTYSPTEWGIGDQVMVRRSFQPFGWFSAFLHGQSFHNSKLQDLTAPLIWNTSFFFSLCYWHLSAFYFLHMALFIYMYFSSVYLYSL